MADERFPGEFEWLRKKLLEQSDQIRLRYEAEQKRLEKAELEKQFLQDKEKRELLEQKVALHLPQDIRTKKIDADLQRESVEILAKDLAEKGVRNPAMMEGLSDAAKQAAHKATDAADLRLKQQIESENLLAKQEAEQARELARKEEEQKREAQEKQAREQKEIEAKKIEAQEVARAEPTPGVVQRFNEILAANKAQREAQTHADNIDRAAEFADHRPNYARHNVLKTEQENSTTRADTVSEKYEERAEPKGEISDARAERYARMFNKPSSDKVFDSTHDPSNDLNYAHDRGGRDGH